LCNEDIIGAKKLMAYEITKLVHGAEEADKVLNVVSSLFGSNSNTDDMQSFEMNGSILESGIKILDLLTMTNFIPSKSEAKRMISQGGISINNEKIENIDYTVTTKNLEDSYIILKRGKKNFLKVVFVGNC
jgi:tyrosyl-tRNA synthetase